MYVVDASVWVASAMYTDVFHHVSRELLTTIMPGGVHLVEPVLLLPEVAGAISRQTRDPELANRTLNYLTNMPGVTFVEIDRKLASDASEISCEHRIRGVDAVYVALAEQFDLDLVSWDSDHLARASQRVTVHRPDELLAHYRGDI